MIKGPTRRSVKRQRSHRQVANQVIRELIKKYFSKHYIKSTKSERVRCEKWIDKHLQGLAHDLQPEKTMIGHMERRAIKASMRVYVLKYLRRLYG